MGKLGFSEIMKVELAGKNTATGRYDETIWKIRSGYMVILATVLGFFSVEGSKLVMSYEILIVILWFSLVAWSIDIEYRRRQLLVVESYNQLISDAVNGKSPEDIEISLFHIAGEKQGLKKNVRIINCIIPSIFIYTGPPLISWLLLIMK